MYIRSSKTGRESFLKARQNLAEVISRTYNYNLQSSIDIPSGIPDMTEFLRTVAKHYFGSLLQSGQGTAHSTQWTDWMFVFPNRRAGLFFKQYLCELNGNKPLQYVYRVHFQIDINTWVFFIQIIQEIDSK